MIALAAQNMPRAADTTDPDIPPPILTVHLVEVGKNIGRKGATLDGRLSLFALPLTLGLEKSEGSFLVRFGSHTPGDYQKERANQRRQLAPRNPSLWLLRRELLHQLQAGL